MSERERIDVLGVKFDNLSMDEAVERALALLSERRAAYVVTPNPEIVLACREDPEAAQAVAGADLTIPDGIGIIYGARLLKTPLKERVPGIDFTTRLLEILGERGGSVFLLGSKPGVAERAWERLHTRFPGLRLAGVHDGYFQDDGPVLEQVNAAAPDLMMVCLGAPKQEKWMRANAPRLRVGLMVGNGGALDVLAGDATRAPAGWQKAGLEWLYRLLKEPTRLGRMMKLPLFLVQVLRARSK